MSIIIKNIGGNPLGYCKYEIRINDKLIATFGHWRPDGLSKCLMEAARAIERQQWEDAHRIISSGGEQ